MGDFRFATRHLTVLIVHSLLYNPTGNREVKNLIQDEGKLGLKLFLVAHPASSLSSYPLLSPDAALSAPSGMAGKGQMTASITWLGGLCSSPLSEIHHDCVTYTKKWNAFSLLLAVTEPPRKVRSHPLGTYGGPSIPYNAQTYASC